MENSPILGVIGGTGVYQFDAVTEIEQREVNTPFGKPSSPIFLGKLNGKTIAFLARHGIGHTIPPSSVNYRANIYALKSIGVRRIVSISACGSLREDFAPGDIVIPDQLVDFTKNRINTFFDSPGMVAHISTAFPFCPKLSENLLNAVKPTGANAHKVGTFITIEGPRFSTKAESQLFRSWGMTIIGMTASPEAFLAREAEMCYATIAHVTDYDTWHQHEEPVTVEMILKILNQNNVHAQKTIENLVDHFENYECECEHALKSALTTNPESYDQESTEKLNLLIKKYIA